METQQLRNLKELSDRINELQAILIRRFTALVDLAAINKTDRAVTAVTQVQIQAETSALIRAAQDVQTLIRQMQEMWLFGQVDTLGKSSVQKETDENAKVVRELLERLTEGRGGGQGGGEMEVEVGG